MVGKKKKKRKNRKDRNRKKKKKKQQKQCLNPRDIIKLTDYLSINNLHVGK